LLRCLTNRENNSLQIVQHIIIGKTEHTITLRDEPLAPTFVMPEALFEIVALAIDFNNKLAGMRDEISGVADWALPPEASAREAMSFQMPPQQCFRTRHCAS
jgi:hypothetical protein